MLLLAHLSDTHVDGDPRSADRTARVMAYLHGLARPPDAILVTGDIADHGEVAEYELAAKLLASPYPVLTCPGNHDRRDAYRKSLLGDRRGGPAPVNTRHDLPGATFLLCDSTVPGHDHGRLDESTLAWLAGQLATVPAGTAVFLAMHHPPIALGHPVMDSLALRSTGPLAALLGEHPEVVALLTGHAHLATASRFAGRPLLIAPGVASSLRLPWEGAGPLVDPAQPPGVAFHLLADTGQLTTAYRFVVGA